MEASERRSRRREAERQENEQDQEGQHEESTYHDIHGHELEEKEFYCPGCGRRSHYIRPCVGTPEHPHPEIDMIPTAELKQEPSEHTPAPDTERLG